MEQFSGPFIATCVLGEVDRMGVGDTGVVTARAGRCGRASVSGPTPPSALVTKTTCLHGDELGRVRRKETVR